MSGNKYINHLILVLVISVIFNSCDNISTSPTINNQQNPYFPAALGNSWDYVSEDVNTTGRISWEITDQIDNTFTIKRTFDEIFTDNINIVVSGEDIDIILENGQKFPFYRFINGLTWLHRDNRTCDDSSTLKATIELNQINTPAGSFSKCIKIVRISPVSCLDAGTMIEWWAPNVGLIKIEVITIAGPRTYYLQSYKLL